MTQSNIKEKRLYFLFSKLNGKQAEKTHFTLIVDTFLKSENAYLNLFDVSRKLLELGINLKPESLEPIIDNKEYLPYFEIPKNPKIDTPFRLNSTQYNILSSYQNYYDKLN